MAILDDPSLLWGRMPRLDPSILSLEKKSRQRASPIAGFWEAQPVLSLRAVYINGDWGIAGDKLHP